jgi:WD40 repeat protein
MSHPPGPTAPRGCRQFRVNDGARRGESSAANCAANCAIRQSNLLTWRDLLTWRALLTWLAVAICAARLTAAEPPTTAACFTPDGKGLLTGSQAGIAQWDWPRLESPRKLRTSLAHVHDLVFSPSGRWLAAVGGRPAESGQVEFYEWPGDDEPDQLVSHAEDVFYQLAWHDSLPQWTVACGDGRLYQGTVGQPDVRPLGGHSRGVLTVASVGNWLFSAGIDRGLRVWEGNPPMSIRSLNNHTATIHDLAVRPLSGDSSPPQLASAAGDRTVRFWQPSIGRLVRFARLPSVPLDIDWLPDGSRLLAACADGHLRVIDPETVSVVADIPAIPAWAYTLAVAPDGRQAVVGGPEGAVRRIEWNAR